VLSSLGFLLYYGSSVWPRRFQQAVFGMLVVAAAMHTVGLLVRMYLQGRPPVTNLYSSAIFIGWAGVVLGLVLERIYRLGIGNAAAAALGGISLIIAHHLATDDTLGVLQAVLDTNFWLATHVTCITLGYTATFLAGAIAIAFVLVGLTTSALAQANVLRTLYGMMYGHRVLCHPVQLHRHSARRIVGGCLLGAILGLGPEGEWRFADCAGQCSGFACPLGWDREAARLRFALPAGEHRNRLELVWYKSDGNWPALVRANGRSDLLAERVLVIATGAYRDRTFAATLLAEFSAGSRIMGTPPLGR
jgi:hypothetical protein